MDSQVKTLVCFAVAAGSIFGLAGALAYAIDRPKAKNRCSTDTSKTIALTLGFGTVNSLALAILYARLFRQS